MKTYSPKYVIIMSFVLIACAIAAMLVPSEKDSAKETAREENKAEIALENFIYALRDGDFETAFSLCDTTLMHDYLEAYKQLWEVKSQKDSAYFAALTSKVENTTIHTANVKELDGVCIIDYTLSMDEFTKQCSATVRKEEGEWKVVTVTDEI